MASAPNARPPFPLVLVLLVVGSVVAAGCAGDPGSQQEPPDRSVDPEVSLDVHAVDAEAIRCGSPLESGGCHRIALEVSNDAEHPALLTPDNWETLADGGPVGDVVDVQGPGQVEANRTEEVNLTVDSKTDEPLQVLSYRATWMGSAVTTPLPGYEVEPWEAPIDLSVGNAEAWDTDCKMATVGRACHTVEVTVTNHFEERRLVVSEDRWHAITQGGEHVPAERVVQALRTMPASVHAVEAGDTQPLRVFVETSPDVHVEQLEFDVPAEPDNRTLDVPGYTLQKHWTPGTWSHSTCSLDEATDDSDPPASLLVTHEKGIRHHAFNPENGSFGPATELAGSGHGPTIVVDGRIYTHGLPPDGDDPSLMLLEPGQGVQATAESEERVALATDGTYIFAAGRNLSVFDRTLDRVASLDLVPEDFSTRKHVHDAVVDGDRLYLVDNVIRPYFLYKVDVSDPADPEILEENELGNANSQWVTDDDRWVVHHGFSGRGGSTSSLTVFPSAGDADSARFQISSWARSLRNLPNEGYRLVDHLGRTPVWGFVENRSASSETQFGVLSLEEAEPGVELCRIPAVGGGEGALASPVSVHRDGQRVLVQEGDRLHRIDQDGDGPSLTGSWKAPPGRVEAVVWP